jgi:hypothetical protein
VAVRPGPGQDSPGFSACRMIRIVRADIIDFLSYSLVSIVHAFMQRSEEARNAVLIGKIHKYRRDITTVVGKKRIGRSCLFSNRLKHPRPFVDRHSSNTGAG